MAKPYYPDWQEPAEKCKMRRAISRPMDILIYSKTRKMTEIRRVQIIKPLHGDPWMVYANTGIKIPQKVTAKTCDSIRHWKEY
jgi:hypothetical protein